MHHWANFDQTLQKPFYYMGKGISNSVTQKTMTIFKGDVGVVTTHYENLHTLTFFFKVRKWDQANAL